MRDIERNLWTCDLLQLSEERLNSRAGGRSTTRLICCGTSSTAILSRDHKRVSLYCFKCGQSRSTAVRVTMKSWLAARQETQILSNQRSEIDLLRGLLPSNLKSSGILLPPNCTPELPLESRLWLAQYGISPERAAQYKFTYSTSIRRTILPVYDPQTGELVYWQGRAHDLRKPKYLTSQSASAGQSIFCAASTRSESSSLTHSVVLTEDVLSSVRVSSLSSFPVVGVSLLGTSMTPGKLTRLLSIINTLVTYRLFIWLDGDGAGRRGASKIRRQLSLQGLESTDINTDRDPKDHSNAEIEALIS